MTTKAIYTNDTDYLETKTWNVDIIGFVTGNPQDRSRQYGTLGEQPLAVCVFDDGRLEAIPFSRLKVKRP
ncbi:hypothetical protein Milano_097 [Agrobacterium phage Milano]|nr:hypothetical protein Milano_097 [Agrobacterium phage Milano]